MTLAACGAGGTTAGTGPAPASGTPQRGGTLTYLVSGVLSSWARGLDPASAGAAPSTFEDAIFGQLFRLAPSGGIEPVLASGYTLADGGRTVTISLRPGVKFQDGTPLNAQAVVWNIQRDLATPCVCSPVTSWPPLAPGGITAPDDRTVVLHFTRPYAAAIQAIISSSVNHIASPTAQRKLGEKQFVVKPVGAGPFEVVSNVLDSQLTLKRYPGYWDKGRPYLSGLVFKTVSDDQTAYQAIQAGQGQATQITLPAIIKQARQDPSVSVMTTNGTSPWLVQLNTAIPPFSSKLARQAIYYATNARAIRTHLFDSMFPVAESFLGPGGLFYRPTVPGYPAYDLARAKQLVSRLGGLTVDLFGPNDTLSSETLAALQTEWGQAGIHVTIHAYPLDREIQAFAGKSWQAALQGNGAFDPAVSAGIAFRFSSSALYSGVHDPVLDKMMAQAASTLNAGQRAALYTGIARYISSQAYAPFLIAPAPAALVAKGVHGPGLTSEMPTPSVVIAPYWDQAWTGKG
jgi:peptide/nickel transport system substrate-binding protein